MNMIELDKVNSYYGDSHILFDVSMAVREKEVVALLGRNGAGKSTTLKTLAGVLHPRSGTIKLAGEEIHRLPTYEIARRGLQLVPDERRIFGSLTVVENLKLAALSAAQPWPIRRIYDMFPRLEERRESRGGNLSGGEQQMLAIARALIRNPRVILLDEPFEGLAAIIVRDILEICQRLVAEGPTVIIVEQNLRAALRLATRVYVLNNGQIVFTGSTDELKANPDITSRYIGI
jgi:branched-chain amino acid transport system ATP-binding protein